MTTVSRPHASNFVAWAKNRPEVVVLSADLTNSCEAGDFRDAYPDRFFSMGMAEQNMMGFAAGLAREGFTPFVHTFAVFITRRPFDQVAMSIAYPNLPVRLLGFLPGITTPGGVTHQAIDDLALMRVIPNMTVLECGDATEVETVLDVAQAIDGPVYVRMLRGLVPRLFDPSQPMVLEQPRVLSRGTDVALISSGICTEEAMAVTAALTSVGVTVWHLHVSTIKPLCDEAIVEAVESTRGGVVVVENHSIIGGLGSAVAERLAERGAGKRMVRLGLEDTYSHGASRAYLMREHGLDSAGILKAIESLLDRDTGLSEADLRRAPVRTLAGIHQPEAL